MANVWLNKKIIFDTNFGLEKVDFMNICAKKYMDFL